MRSWYGRLSSVAHARGRTVTRRRLVAGGAAAAILRSRQAPVAAQDGFVDDLAVLNFAVSVERLEADLYRAGLRAFDEAAFRAADRPDAVHDLVTMIRDQEQVHVDQLTEEIVGLGGELAAPATHEFELTDVDGFLTLAAGIERVAVGAHAGAAPFLTDRSLQEALLGLLSADARHSAYLNLQVGSNPFPPDRPLTPTEATTELDALAPTHDATPAGDETNGGQGDRRFAELIADAASRQGVAPGEVTIVQTERRDWSDSSLGCPEPGRVYAQVITPGFLVIVEADGVQLEYHTDRRGNFVLC